MPGAIFRKHPTSSSYTSVQSDYAGSQQHRPIIGPRLLSLFLTLTVILQTATVFANDSIVLGIFPYASPDKLARHQRGLRDHLSQGINQPIQIATAVNFKTFIDKAKQGIYDLVYAPPHLARLLEKEYAYQRITMTTHHIQGMFITLKTAPYKQLKDLHNKTIALAPPIAILSQLAIQELRDAGLTAKKDYTVVTMKNFENAMFSVLNRDSDVALTGIKLWDILSAKYKDKLKALSPTQPIPGFFVMARPDMAQKAVENLRQLSLSFNQTPAGKHYLFQSLQRIDDTSMQGLDKFTPILKQ